MEYCGRSSVAPDDHASGSIMGGWVGMAVMAVVTAALFYARLQHLQECNAVIKDGI